MASVYETVVTRRSIYDFTDRPVDRAEIENILEAGVWAPNHKLTEPWRFIVLGPSARAKLADLAGKVKADALPPEVDTAARSAVRVKSANKVGSRPAIIVIVCRRSSDEQRDLEDYAATCCAIQNMSLVAWELGLGCQWSSGAVTRDSRAAGLLGIDAAGERIVGLLYLGRPKAIPLQSRTPASDCTVWLD